MAVGKNIRRVNNIWGNQQPFVSLYLTRNMISWYLCYYIDGRLQPIWILLLSSSSLWKGRKTERPKTVPRSQNAMADPDKYPNKGGSPCHQELS